MDSFEIKGDNGLLRISISEVFGFPNQTSHFGGYDCRADIEIRVPSYFVKGDFYTTTGEIFNFYEALNKCQKEIKGDAKYSTSEGNLELNVNFDELGHTEVYGRFQQTMGIGNNLSFEIKSDQSFIKYTVYQLLEIFKKYGNNYGKEGLPPPKDEKENKSLRWKFWK